MGPSDDDSDRASQHSTIASPSIETVLGLRCLTIVLSYLEECEGTSFLLTQKCYWTDTILPILRIKLPPEFGNDDSNNARKHRHRMSGRHREPLIKIPDATTRLDRLNTRRYNKRHRREGKHQRINDCENDNDSDNHSCQNFPLAVLAKDEWNETTTTTISTISTISTENNNHRRRSELMNPPLLRFYNEQSYTKRQLLFAPGTTCLASYPRSGNTLLRSLLETVTGFVTSSDTRPDRNLSIALAEKPPYFVGEGLAPPPNFTQQQQQQDSIPPPPFLTPQQQQQQQQQSSSSRRRLRRHLLPPPPICKTHWPERIGCHRYDCHRVILLVRNPFDAVDSYWHMNLTNTHTEKVQPTITEEHRGFYESLVRHEILCVWISFLDYYWKECSKHKVPLLIVRYEDLVLNPRDELQRILEFCCETTTSTTSSSSCSDGSENKQGDNWWKNRLEEVTRNVSTKEKESCGGEKRKTDNFGYRSSSCANDETRNGASSSSSSSSIDGNNNHTTNDTAQNSNQSSQSNNHTTNDTAENNNQSSQSKRSSHPSIGRSLRRGMFPQTLLKAIHDFDDDNQPKQQRPREFEFGGKWLQALGYHVYKQGFPNNLDNLPPVPVLDNSIDNNNNRSGNGDTCGGGGGGSLAINVQDVSIELRPRDSPYGRNMRRWRRQRTFNDTEPFPTI